MERKPSSVAMTAWARNLDQVSYEYLGPRARATGVDLWRQAVSSVEATLQRIVQYLAEHSEDASIIPSLRINETRAQRLKQGHGRGPQFPC